MKTTIDIADNLLHQIKELSRREQTTIRDLVEEGLDLVLNRYGTLTSYRAEPVIFTGDGISPEFQNASWEIIRDAAYHGRGS